MKKRTYFSSPKPVNSQVPINPLPVLIFTMGLFATIITFGFTL